MKSPHRVSSKVKLAAQLGISPPTLYAYLRMQDSPPARNGFWYVSDFRKFITRKQTASPDERRQLELDLLKARVAKSQHELDEALGKTRREIWKELLRQFEEVLLLARTEFYRMRVELCPRFETRSAREISRLWGTREDETFRTICAELEKKGQATPDIGAMQPGPNGSKLAELTKGDFAVTGRNAKSDVS